MTMFIFGAIVGTFIPTPYQAEIRRYASILWGRIKGLVKSTD